MNLKRSVRQSTRVVNACGFMVDIDPFGPESIGARALPQIRKPPHRDSGKVKTIRAASND
jgi:hypothetical protein